MDPEFRIEKINESHDTSEFDCGRHHQNRYLREYALSNSQAGYGRTYLAIENTSGDIAGFYTLAMGKVEFDTLPESFVIGRDLPRYPAPTVLIGQLGVSTHVQGRGLGGALLFHALETALKGAEIIAAVAVEVDAAERSVRGFYERYGFVQMKDSPNHLFLGLEQVRTLVEE